MRIFFDMDGTIAEWKEIKLKAEEDINEVLNHILSRPRYYAELGCYENIISLMKMLQDDGYEIFTLSCYRPDTITIKSDGSLQKSTPMQDKKEWLSIHTPFFTDETHQLFVPDGIDKAQYLKEFYHIEISATDILIDDYHKNLKDWARAGGTPVKCVNGINSYYNKYYNISTYIDYTKQYSNQFLPFVSYLKSIDKEFAYDR